MGIFLRVQDGAAVEEWSEPDGFSVNDCFTSEIAETFHPKGEANIGWLWDGSKFSEPQAPVVDLNVFKAQLRADIDMAAETERLKYITAGAGQAMTYSQKADEATRYRSAASPVATDYPMLNAEVGITAATINEVATVVSSSFAQWQVIGAAIERTRLGAKKSIDAADTVEEANSAVNAILWPGA